MKTQELMIENFVNSVIFANAPESISDVLSIIENPFINRKDIDATSLIFHRFYKHTDIPIALPVFGFFSMVSAWLVFNKTTMKVPFTTKATELNTWIMALAQSGSNKTMAFNQLLRMLPTDPSTGEPIVTPNVAKPNGAKAMIQQLAALPDNRGYWFQDEAAQMFKGIEQPGSPMSEVKEILLKIKDGDKVERLNSREYVSAEGTVMTQFFINTIDSMAKTLSEESMHDGLFRRYQVAIAEKDERDFTNFALYKLDELLDDTLSNELSLMFSQDITDKQFSFTTECTDLYNECFGVFWKRQYVNFMTGSENVYRTYMMEAWKYAVFHHVINKRHGLVVDESSLQYGLKVSMFLLNSLQSFIKYRAGTKSIQVQQSKVDKLIEFIMANENKKGFGSRAVQRKFTMKKDELIETLRSIKQHNPKFKTKLLDLLKKD